MTSIPEGAYDAAWVAYRESVAADAPGIVLPRDIRAAVDAAAPLIREATRVELLAEQDAQETQRLANWQASIRAQEQHPGREW